MFLNFWKGYAAVPSNDCVSEKPRRKATQCIRTIALLLVLLATLFAGYVIGVISSSHIYSSTTTKPSYLHAETVQAPYTKDQPLHCGTSIEEALELGCTFDHLTLQWLPVQCDRTGDKEYRALFNDSYDYWYNTNGTDSVVDYTHELRDEGFWTAQRHHVAHCAIMYTRMSAAVLDESGEIFFDHKIWSSGHATHCSEILLKWALQAPDIELPSSFEWAHVKLGKCWPRKPRTN